MPKNRKVTRIPGKDTVYEVDGRKTRKIGKVWEKKQKRRV